MTVPRVASFHPSREARQAVESLQRAVDRVEGIGLLVGPAGTGKSLLLACLRERLADTYAIALLSGGRICTRRGLWQAILADLDEPYRGLDEEELRMNLVERLRGLAATGSGLVVLVDEAHTLPRRLLEELRLLAGVLTDRPAVHLVLAGTVRLEELLGEKDCEGLAQRVAVRAYLEPLDYEETCGYLRTQMRAAGLIWEDRFAAECEAAIYTITDGVPRLINQLCDQAIRLAEARGAARVATADIAAAWEEIQRLPPPAALAAGRPAEPIGNPADDDDRTDGAAEAADAGFADDDPAATIIEFGSLDEDPEAELPAPGVDAAVSRTVAFAETGIDDDADPDAAAATDQAEEEASAGAHAVDFEASRRATEYAIEALARAAGGFDGLDSDAEVMMRLRPRSAPGGPECGDEEIELVFDPPFDADDPGRADPFAELFADEESVVERFVMRGPDDFHHRLHVASREGQAIGRQLPQAAAPAADGSDGLVAEPVADPVDEVADDVPSAATPGCPPQTPEGSSPTVDCDDSDMVVIEEDDHPDPNAPDGSVFAVRLGDYSQLFARLRRGGGLESSRRA